MEDLEVGGPEETVEEEKKEKTAKTLTPQEISKRIQSAVKWQKKGHYQKEDARWKQWEKNKKYLMCIWPGSEENDVNVNTVRANFQTVRPTLFFKNPKITVTPTKPNFTRDSVGNVQRDESGRPILADNYTAAKIASLKLNYELKEIKFKKLMRAVTGDVICPYGIGWAKVGFSRLTVGGHDNDRDTSYTYWIQRIDPRNVVYDWMATNIDNVHMLHERLILTRQEADEYGFKIPDDYIPKLPDFLSDRSKTAKSENHDDDLVIVWETEDLKNKMLYWTIGDDKEGTTSFAKEPAEFPYPFEGSAHVPLVLNEDNDDIIGLSDVEPIEDQAKAINRGRTKQTKHVEWFGSRIVYEDGAIEPSDIEKTKVTDHGVYIKVKGGGLNSVKIEGTPSMGQDNYAMIQEHKEDIRTTLGITEFQQGSVGNSSTKATIGNIVQNSSIARVEEKRDLIHDFVIECVRKLFACIQEFSTEEEYLNLKDEVIDEDFVDVIKKDYGYDPKIPFLMMSREDIQGEYNFDFNVEDMVVQPKEVRAQLYTNFLNMVFSNPVITQKFSEEFDVGKTLKKGAELFGIDLGELRKGGPQMLTPEQENQMFLSGQEVPEPHHKDHDDEHIVSHTRVMNELNQQAQGVQQQMMELQQQVTVAAQQVVDPAQLQALQQQTQLQLQQFQEQLLPIMNIIRRVKIHLQTHESNRGQKDNEAAGGGGGMGGPQPQGQPSASMQTAMQGQIGAA